jgi:Effector-associated domain 2/Caspase domain
MNPSDTHAVVVGIEKYDVSPAWNLNGPAVDAARFVHWLRLKGVPKQNIVLFGAPLDENKSYLEALDVENKPADHKAIMEAITGDIAKRNGELLIVFWGGHGVIGDGVRRLFFSDVAENYLLNLDLESLLKFLRSASVARFPQQVCIVDACANYFELMQSPIALADVPVTQGNPRLNISQIVLFGAGAGERAKNLSAIRSGLFSSILLEELEKLKEDGWPPDLACVQKQVEERMLTMRLEGRAKQTPAHYYYRDWGHSEGTFQNLGAEVSAEQDRELTLDERDQLVNALLKCASLSVGNRRNQTVADLRPSIAHDIERDAATKFDVIAIVRTCARFRGGLSEFIHIVETYEGNSKAAANVREIANVLKLDKF